MPSPFPFQLPRDFEAHGSIQIFRKTDGRRIGSLTWSNEEDRKISASFVENLDKSSTSCKVSQFQYMQDAIAAMAEFAATIPDPTANDPDVVRVCGSLHRILMRIPGGGFIATHLASPDDPPAAFRDGLCVGRMTKLTSTWRVSAHLGDRATKRFASYDNALMHLGDLAMAENPTGHDRLEREEQKRAYLKEARLRRRNKSGESA